MTHEPLPDLIRPLFWDYDFADLRWPDHRDLVIARVLQRGGDDDIRWLRGKLGDDGLGLWIRQSRGQRLDPRRLRFWQLVLQLPAEEVDRWIENLRALPQPGSFP